MAGLENALAAAAAEGDFDLTTVKLVTQQVMTFGFENVKDPIFQWRLLISDIEHLQGKAYSSDLFMINNSDLFGRLNLTSSTYESKITLSLTDSEKGNKIVDKLNPFQFFVCKIKQKYNHDRYNGGLYEKISFSMNAFNANECEFHFKFTLFGDTNLTVELYQEPLAMIEYRSPYNNMAVGKIEKFRQMMGKTDSNKIFSVSPRIKCGSFEQLIIVKFYCSTLPNTSTPDITSGLSATLHFLNPSGAKIQPCYFAITFTIFSQDKSVKDLIYKSVFRPDKNKSDFNALLVISYELDPYLRDSNLYYKVAIEPRPSK